MSIDVFDFFSGCGGTSRGFQEAGLHPVFALDFDKDAAKTFKANFPKASFEEADITAFDPTSIESLVKHSDVTLFCGCAPCQPFTQQNTIKPNKSADARRFLLGYFQTLVKMHLPDYVFVENVPGLQRVTGNSTLNRFERELESLGYSLNSSVVKSQCYGVPQRRKRLVLLASRHGKVDLPKETHGPDADHPFSTVRGCIGHYPSIEAGGSHPETLNHSAAKLSEKNLKRIRATPPEGSRADWPAELRLKCHTKPGYTGHTDVYGRMKWDEPATSLTTKCTSLSNGRFGHPEQHRAISAREAAALQTFPDDFKFFGSLQSQAKQIGNAVPVLLAKAFGSRIAEHTKQSTG